jgi:5-methylcytosine-specific restriction endonuclease McrA
MQSTGGALMITLHRPPCPNPQALADGDYTEEQNKAALLKSSHDKCMYCESKLGAESYPQIEHIRPKSKYPNLEFVWTKAGYFLSGL